MTGEQMVKIGHRRWASRCAHRDGRGQCRSAHNWNVRLARPNSTAVVSYCDRHARTKRVSA